MNRCKEANVWDVGINCKKDQERKATRQCDGARAWPWQGKDRCSQSALLHHGGLHCKHSNGHFKQRTRYILTFVWNKILYASCGRAPSPVTNFPTLTKPWPGHQCERGVKTTQWRPGCVPVSWTSWSGLVVLRDGFPKKVAVNLDNLYHFFWTPMCLEVWAGVSPSLPIPKLTQYIQFVKSGQKFGQGPPLPPHLDKIQKNSYFFFGRPSSW